MGQFRFNTVLVGLALLRLPRAVDDLKNWIHSVGGVISPKVVVKTRTYGGRGVFVTGAVGAGETLLSIPLEAMLLGQDAAKKVPCREQIWTLFQQSNMEDSEKRRTLHIFSIMVLILASYGETRSKERLSPHINDLLDHWRADAWSRFPLLWPRELLSEIKGTTALEVFDIAMQGVANEFYSALGVACPELTARHSLQTYSEVWLLVNSHVVKHPGGVVEPQVALIPFLDMVNHHLPKPAKKLPSDSQVARYLRHSLGRFGTSPPDGGPAQTNASKKLVAFVVR